MTELAQTMTLIGQQAKRAARAMLRASDADKAAALSLIADRIDQSHEALTRPTTRTCKTPKHRA